MKNSSRQSPSEFEQFMQKECPPIHEPIKLADGRIVRIGELCQFETYGGLIMGRPNEQINKKRIDAALSYAKDKIWSATEPTLIPPVICEPKITEEDITKYVIFDQPQYLPIATCMAQLESSPARDKKMFRSKLTVVWFQDQYAFPIDPHVLECIMQLDWTNIATDIDFDL